MDLSGVSKKITGKLAYLSRKILHIGTADFVDKHFGRYKGRLSAKIEAILKYDEADVGLAPENQEECALPGFKRYLKSGHYKYMLARYMYSIKYIKKKSVLDAGCGLGWGAYLISDYPSEIVAIDRNEGALRFAREAWKDAKINFKNHSILDLVSLNKKFDVITGFEVIEHLNFADGKRFLEQAFKALNDRGVLILSSLFPDSRERAERLEKENVYHLKIFTKSEMRMFTEEIGFREIEFMGDFIAVIGK